MLCQLFRSLSLSRHTLQKPNGEMRICIRNRESNTNIGHRMYSKYRTKREMLVSKSPLKQEGKIYRTTSIDTHLALCQSGGGVGRLERMFDMSGPSKHVHIYILANKKFPILHVFGHLSHGGLACVNRETSALTCQQQWWHGDLNRFTPKICDKNRERKKEKRRILC